MKIYLKLAAALALAAAATPSLAGDYDDFDGYVQPQVYYGYSPYAYQNTDRFYEPVWGYGHGYYGHGYGHGHGHGHYGHGHYGHGHGHHHYHNHYMAPGD